MRRAITILALAFFALPIAARAVGVTARPFENRPMAPRPELDAGWGVFDQTTRFFVDRMPLREEAVRAHTWASLHVLDTSPTWRRDLAATHAATAGLPQQQAPAPAAQEPARDAPETEPASPEVVVAGDGWLFLGEDLMSACGWTLTPAQVVARIERFVRALERRGTRVVVAIAPDKTTIYPGRVPEDTPRRACAERRRAALWPALEDARGVVALRDDLAAAQRASDELLYKRKDTHWNAAGALVLVERVLERLPGRVRVRPEDVEKRPPLEYEGDLTITLGARETDRTPDRAIRRAPGAARLGGRTVLVSDSFGEYVEPLLRPYAADFRKALWARDGIPAVARAIRRADTVVFEVVERELDFVVADGRTFDELLAALER